MEYHCYPVNDHVAPDYQLKETRSYAIDEPPF